MNKNVNIYFEKSEKEIFSYLLNFWNIQKRYLKIYGKYTGQSFLSEITFYNWKTDEEILLEYPSNLGIIEKVYIGRNEELTFGHYYEFVPQLNDYEIRKQYNNPFLLKVDNSSIKSSWKFFNKRKEFIKDWFAKKGRTPEDASTIAGQLTLNGLELYTETERFIFELIQNADDVPLSSKGVDINIKKTKDFLLFMHNGQYFLRENVKAIADAAKSTKKNKQNQTGYKGIGFKSVFTDAESVYINSGGYSFKFDKNFFKYKDCIQLYEWHLSKLTDNAKNEEIAELEKHRTEYQKIENIPWQIKPIWTNINDYEDQVKDREFLNNNVAIALRIGQQKFKEKQYEKKLIKLFNDPRFILFLRNVRNIKLKLDNSEIDISVKSFDNTVFFYKNEQLQYVYYKSDKNETPGFLIQISETNFNNANVNLKIRVDESSKKREFVDFQNQIVSNIPEKLASAKNTVISFAIETEKRKYDNYEGIKKYPKGSSILFNYLPTSDAKYEFPFLVNADFITETNRQYILKENKWNHFLFYHIGYYHIQWSVAILKDKPEYHGSYLNIIVSKKLNVEGHEDICNAFNRGFDKAINEISFILTIDNELKKANEVIIDNSEISKHISPELFYLLFGNDLKLVHHEIDTSKLSGKDFGIKQISITDFCNRLKELSGLEIFNKWIKKSNQDIIVQAFETIFLNEDNNLYLLKDKYDFKDIFYSIEFIHCTDDECYSLNNFETNPNLIQSIKQTKDIVIQLVKKLDFVLTYHILDEGNNIYRAIRNSRKLKNNETLFNTIKERIEDEKYNQKLDKEDKKLIHSNFLNFYKTKQAEIAQIKLFYNSKASKVLTPTNELLSRSAKKNYPKWLEPFQINNEEYYLELDSYNFFIADIDIYEKIIYPFWSQITDYVIKNSQSIENFFNQVIALYKFANQQDDKKLPSLNEEQFIFVNDIFLNKETIFYHSAIINSKEFEILSQAIKKVTDINVPDFSILQYVTQRPFNLRETTENIKLLLQNIENKTDELSTPELRELFVLIRAIDGEKANELKLFHNQQGNIKSLNQLLSTQNENLPYWLDDFKIAEKEYENDYETLFLQPKNVYSETILQNWNIIITKLLSLENPDIEQFYTQITNNFYTKGKQRISDDSLAYIYSDNGFELKEGIFWHTEFSLAEVALEKLTNRKLPYDNIVKFLKDENSPFYIAKEDNIIDLIEKDNTELELQEAQAFIEFAIKTEKRIFDKGYFDNLFNFHQTENAKQYDLSEINVFIETHFSGKYIKLSEQLRNDKDLVIIGLISNDNFKTEILNSLNTKTQFADLIIIISDWDKQYKELYLARYFKEIQQIDLSIEKTYSKQSFEYNLIKLFLSIFSSDEAIEKLRKKIFINNICITEIETKQDITVDENLTLLYSDIITNAKDNSNWIDKFIGEFDDSNLTTNIFYKTDENIHTTADYLKSTGLFTHLSQFVFAAYYVKDNDPKYLSYFNNTYTEIEILNHFYKNNYPIYRLKSYLRLKERNFVYPEKYAIPSEYLTSDYKTWNNEEPDKLKYLANLGLNNLNSNVVRLRKHFANPASVFNSADLLKIGIQLIKNTLIWLEQEDIIIDNRTFKTIESIYQIVVENEPETPVLVFNSLNDSVFTYKLKTTIDKPIFGIEHLKGKQKAFELLKSEDILSSIHSAWFGDIDAQEIQIEQKPDKSKLSSAQKQENDFQTKWNEETEYEIYFYNGQIPYLDYISQYESDAISVSEKTSDIELIDNSIYINSKQIINLKSLLSKITEDEKTVNRYFSWKNTYELLQYLKGNNTSEKNFKEFNITDTDLFLFIINNLENQIFSKNDTKISILTEIYSRLDSNTENLYMLVYKDYSEQLFTYQVLNINGISCLNGLTTISDKDLHSQIIAIANKNKTCLISEICERFIEAEQTSIKERELNIDINSLGKWNANIYNNWEYKEKYEIRLLNGKIPLKDTFIGTAIKEYADKDTYKQDDLIIINNQELNNIKQLLNQHLNETEFNTLFSINENVSNMLIDNDVSEQELLEFIEHKKQSKKTDTFSKTSHYEETKLILGDRISDDIIKNANYEAKSVIIEYLLSENLITNAQSVSNYDYSFLKVKYRLLEKDSIIIVKSAKQGILYVNPNELHALSANNCKLIAWFGGNNIKTYEKPSELFENSPNALIRVNKNDLKEKLELFLKEIKYIGSSKFIFYSPDNISDVFKNLLPTNEKIDLGFSDDYLDKLELDF